MYSLRVRSVRYIISVDRGSLTYAALLTEDSDVNRVGWKGVDDGRVNPAVTRPRAADHQVSRLDVQQSAVCKGPFMV